MKLVNVIVKVKVTLEMKDKANVQEVVEEAMQEMDYDFTSTVPSAKVYDTTIEDFEVRS